MLQTAWNKNHSRGLSYLFLRNISEVQRVRPQAECQICSIRRWRRKLNVTSVRSRFSVRMSSFSEFINLPKSIIISLWNLSVCRSGIHPKCGMSGYQVLIAKNLRQIIPREYANCISRFQRLYPSSGIRAVIRNTLSSKSKVGQGNSPLDVKYRPSRIYIHVTLSYER